MCLVSKHDSMVLDKRLWHPFPDKTHIVSIFDKKMSSDFGIYTQKLELT